MNPLVRRRSRRIAGLLGAVTLAACATAVEPWDRRVEGAQSVSGWFGDIPLEVGPSGAGLPSSDDVLAGIRDMEKGIWAVADTDVDVGFLGGEGDTTGVGYARTTFPAGPHPLLAIDLRFNMRHDATGWRIVSAERRYHCATEVATELCQ